MKDSIIKIGNLKLENNLILAPMLGVNCRAFRIMCRQHGAGLVCSPMVNVESLKVKGKDLLDDYVDIAKEERPISVQIVGNRIDLIKDSVEFLQDHADIVDLNFGCCDQDVLANKSGAFFIKHPEQLSKVINAAADSCNLKPLTAKIRIGWDDKSVNAVEVAKMIEDAGAAAVAVHARTRKQGYSGKADWTVIRKVKESVNIPVIGNGDVTSPETAKMMIEKTSCDALMIGRGAMGRPWLFSQIKDFFESGRYDPHPGTKQRYALFKEFLGLYEQQRRQKFSEVKQHAMWLTKGMKMGKEAKNSLMRKDDVKGLKSVFERMVKDASG